MTQHRFGSFEWIALYASTPDYKKLLEMHGWDAMLSPLIEMSRAGQWREMGELVTDEMMEQYAVIGRPDDVVRKLRERFGGLVDRIQLDDEWFEDLADDDIRALVASIKAI